ncbi:Endonuclease YncB, thermonuclease family [Novosphingobium sp. B1]|nr:Endonuclease YncB, thermonuclease family [Novosphingobium sp. B1]
MRLPIALALLALSVPAAGQIVSGHASALDGDTLDMTGQRLRLFGIDAPESTQKCLRDGATWDCGAQAKRQLAMLIDGAEPECRVVVTDPQGIGIARCTVAARDLSEALVAAGLAVVTAPSPDEPALAEAQQLAKEAKVGIWAGTFEMPSQWRKSHPQARLPIVSRHDSQGSGGSGNMPQRPVRKVYRHAFGCAIKGNISHRNGEHIYYLPGMKYYDGTRPERLFCSEEEAQSAGYRLSRGG